MRHMRLAAVLATTFTWLLPAAAGAQDKPIELKFSSWVSAVHGHHTGVMVPWAKMVEEKSGGRLKITIFPGSTLGKAVDHYDMIKDGIADMGFMIPGKIFAYVRINGSDGSATYAARVPLYASTVILRLLRM